MGVRLSKLAPGEHTDLGHMIIKVVRSMYLPICFFRWRHESLIVRNNPSKKPPIIVKQTD